MTNRFAKFLMLGASPLMLAIAQPAYAQSTATQQLEAIESVTVSGQKLDFGGIMAPVTVAKERTTIGQDYISTQASGQSIFETLNKVPGFNFTNSDPYGNSGGNIRIHGFDGNHISFTWDGMPLNDTGNYAIFTNQVADSEVIGKASVNQGTTDVDSPTASATGGVVSIITSRPKSDFRVQSDTSFGSYNYVREFLRVDSGEFGPWGTTAFASMSFTNYDKRSSSMPPFTRTWEIWAGSSWHSTGTPTAIISTTIPASIRPYQRTMAPAPLPRRTGAGDPRASGSGPHSAADDCSSRSSARAAQTGPAPRACLSRLQG